jgi:hypothetical protein
MALPKSETPDVVSYKAFFCCDTCASERCSETAKGHHHRRATLWRLAVESWLRGQGVIVIRQNQKLIFKKLAAQLNGAHIYIIAFIRQAAVFGRGKKGLACCGFVFSLRFAWGSRSFN